MGEIVNLNKARKEKAKEEAKAKAAQNRAAKGQARETKDLFRLKLEKARKELDLHRLDKPEK